MTVQLIACPLSNPSTQVRAGTKPPNKTKQLIKMKKTQKEVPNPTPTHILRIAYILLCIRGPGFEPTTFLL